MAIPRNAWVAASVVLAAIACSRPKVESVASAPEPIVSAAPSTSPAITEFGKACVADADCVSTVCFHKRLHRGAEAKTKESRDGGDEALEHDGYCSMKCDADEDCPSPPTKGKCGARGMCKRSEG